MNKQEIIQKTTEELLNALEISGTVSVETTDEMSTVTIETEESGMVIGHHGDILEALQLLISMAATKKLGEFVRVSVEVGDYKKNRTGWLETLAQQSKERALSSGHEVPLSNLKAWERRVVHLILQEDPEVVSESVGEGKDRTLVVKPRQ